MKNTELLAPAGNIEAAVQAIHNGADAVYMGGKSFGARAFAGNFSLDEMKKAIDYAHLYGVKVYLTVNTIVYENEVEDFLKYIEAVYQLGVDALIMQDVGMITRVHNMFPDVEIHASTQMHNHNDACLAFAKNLGMTRAVLARETSIKEIKSFNTDIEKEVFIHGALCISYSGQCLFSALTQNRSGNRGKCAQSCRMKYSLVDSDNKVVSQDGDYILSPKDLAIFEDIKELIDSKVDSFKMEGRMKAPQYVGHITKIYRKLINNYKNNQKLEVEKEDKHNLQKLFNRGFTKGHLFEEKGKALMGIKRPNHRGIPLGQVISINKNRIRLRLDDTLHQGDGIKFEQSDKGFICNKIYKNGKLVNKAHRGDTIEVDKKAYIQNSESVVKTSDVQLKKELQNYSEKKIGISGHLVAKRNQKLSFKLSDYDGNSITVYGDDVQQSKTRPTTKEELIKNISKLGGTPFKTDNITVKCDDEIFIAKSQINALRRIATDRLIDKRVAIPHRRIIDYSQKQVSCNYNGDDAARLHVLVRNMEQFDAIKDIITGDIYTNDIKLYNNNKDEYKNLRLKTDKLEKVAGEFDKEKLLIADQGSLYLNNENNDFIVDYSIHAVNADTLSYLVSKNVRRISLSPELDIAKIGDMIKSFKDRNGYMPPLESLVYACHELMAMQHCIIANAYGKKQHCGLCKNQQYYISDIEDNRYPVVTDDKCNNYILNSKYMKMDVHALKGMGIRDFRIEFFDEDEKMCKEIVEWYLKQID